MGFGFNWAPPSVLVDTIGLKPTIADDREGGPRRFQAALANAQEGTKFFDDPRSTWGSSSSLRKQKVLERKMAQVPEVYVLGGLSDRLCSQLEQGEEALRRDDARGGARCARKDPDRAGARSRSPTPATSPPSSTASRATSGRSSSRSTRRSAACPTSRHEAACASGSIALLAASAEIEAQRYDLAVRGRRRADEDGRCRRRWRLPRHRGVVRARGEGHRVPVPEALRQARRRVRQALRPEGRAPRRDQHDQLRERQAQPERADPHLVHELRPRDEP